MDKFDLSNIRIMIVDDYTPMRKILMSVLRELGVNKLSQAPGGREALRNLKDNEPDVILADAIMEPMDGLEFTRKVRAGEAGVNPFVPIIMVSGQAEMRHILKARDAGVTEFLAKPISAQSVYTRLCSVINNPRPFIRTSDFFGPDRRRHAIPYAETERRTRPHDYGEGESTDEEGGNGETAAAGKTKPAAGETARTKTAPTKAAKQSAG